MSHRSIPTRPLLPRRALGSRGRRLIGDVALLALLACMTPSNAGADARTTTVLDDRGRVATVTDRGGVTAYDYFDDDSIKEMREPGGRQYVFDEGAIPARLATAAPNFLPALAAGGSDALGVSGNRFLFGSFSFERELHSYLTPAGRLYDPELGRFIQQDSRLGNLDDPPSLNRYLYANANPLRYVDPSGNETASAGCYWGAATCGQSIPLTSVEKRAFGGVVGTLAWAGRTALGTLKLALGMGWEGFGEKVVGAADDPSKAFDAAREGLERHVNASLDRAQERLDRGEHFQAAAAFTEEVTAPTAAAVLGAGDLAVAGARSGVRMLGQGGAAEASLVNAGRAIRPTTDVAEMVRSGEGFVVTEGGLASANPAKAPPVATFELPPQRVSAPPPAPRVTGQALIVLRAEFEQVTKPGYWREYVGQIDEGAIANPFGRGEANLSRMRQGLPPIGPDGKSVPLHHIRPLSRGGTNSFDNLVPFNQTTHQRYTKLLHNEPFPGQQYHVQAER